MAQLGGADYGTIGFVVVVDVAVTLLVAHILWEASWPAYAAAIPQIVMLSSLAVSCCISRLQQ